MSAVLLVMAKAPAPHRTKTRLSPPCTPVEAARLAEAALADTLATVASVDAGRHVLVLDGDAGPWVPAGIEVRAQRGNTFNERLAAAFDDVGTPSVLIGMDTPQVSAWELGAAIAALDHGATDAVLGLATDGGWWAIGFRERQPSAFEGIPMSADDTGARQLKRLQSLGLSVTMLPRLRDVDRFSDARIVADQIPASRFARSVRDLAFVARAR